MLRGRRLEGFEKSFKMTGRTVLPDRFLAGIHKSDISPRDLYSICDRMGMPERFSGAFKERAQDANAFHFGYEKSETRGLYKVYLEFASRLKTHAQDPALLHLAYKWDPSLPAAATVARYEYHPGLALDRIFDRVSALYAGIAAPAAVQPVRSIIEQAASGTTQPLMYLEVGEEGNPRASFDIKLHEADLHIEDILPSLNELCAHLEIPADVFQSVICGLGTATVGHLSGGLSREGKAFLTVYYPARMN